MDTKRELRPVTSLGMFDLLKGMNMFFVIFGHTEQCFHREHPILQALSGAVFTCLFIAAGYGVRKKSFSKASKQVSKMFLKPYLYTAAGTVLGYLLVNTYFSNDFPGALERGSHILVSFALGQHTDTQYWGHVVNSEGPMWFLVALGLGWILVSVSLKYLGERNTGILCVAMSLLAPYTGITPMTPFCLSFLDDAALGIYLGYLIQSKGLLEKKQPFYVWALFVLGAALSLGEALGLRFTLAGRIIELKARTALPAFAFSYGIVYIFTHINRRYNPILGFFEWVGHNSMTVLALHSIEYLAAHWHIFIEVAQDKLHISDTTGVIGLFLLRTTLILIGVKFINWFKEKMEERGVNL